MSDDDKPSLAEAIRLLAERDRRSLGNHPAIEELAAYHARELAPQAEARVREHLAVCHECTDLLLDLINFADLTPPPGEPDLTDDEMDEDWQALRARMGEAAKPPAPVVPIRPVVPAPVPNRAQPPWFSLAASLLAVLGIGFAFYQSFRVNEFARQLEELRQPSVVATLDPSGDNFRGEAEEPEPARVSSEKGGSVLLYPVDESQPYQVELTRGGEVLWSDTHEGFASLIIPGGFLEPGSYLIHVYELNGGKKTLADEIPLEVDDP